MSVYYLALAIRDLEAGGKQRRVVALMNTGLVHSLKCVSELYKALFGILTGVQFSSFFY